MLTGRRLAETVRHVRALQHDATAVRHLEPRDHPQARRLAAARRPEHREELAFADSSVDVVDRGVAAEALADTVERDRDSGIFGHGRV